MTEVRSSSSDTSAAAYFTTLPLPLNRSAELSRKRPADTSRKQPADQSEQQSTDKGRQHLISGKGSTEQPTGLTESSGEQSTSPSREKLIDVSKARLAEPHYQSSRLPWEQSTYPALVKPTDRWREQLTGPVIQILEAVSSDKLSETGLPRKRLAYTEESTNASREETIDLSRDRTVQIESITLKHESSGVTIIEHVNAMAANLTLALDDVENRLTATQLNNDVIPTSYHMLSSLKTADDPQQNSFDRTELKSAVDSESERSGTHAPTGFKSYEKLRPNHISHPDLSQETSSKPGHSLSLIRGYSGKTSELLHAPTISASLALAAWHTKEEDHHAPMYLPLWRPMSPPEDDLDATLAPPPPALSQRAPALEFDRAASRSRKLERYCDPVSGRCSRRTTRGPRGVVTSEPRHRAEVPSMTSRGGEHSAPHGEQAALRHATGGAADGNASGILAVGKPLPRGEHASPPRGGASSSSSAVSAAPRGLVGLLSDEVATVGAAVASVALFWTLLGVALCLVVRARRRTRARRRRRADASVAGTPQSAMLDEMIRAELARARSKLFDDDDEDLISTVRCQPTYVNVPLPPPLRCDAGLRAAGACRDPGCASAGYGTSHRGGYRGDPPSCPPAHRLCRTIYREAPCAGGVSPRNYDAASSYGYRRDYCDSILYARDRVRCRGADLSGECRTSWCDVRTCGGHGATACGVMPRSRTNNNCLSGATRDPQANFDPAGVKAPLRDATATHRDEPRHRAKSYDSLASGGRSDTYSPGRGLYGGALGAATGYVGGGTVDGAPYEGLDVEPVRGSGGGGGASSLRRKKPPRRPKRGLPRTRSFTGQAPRVEPPSFLPLQGEAASWGRLRGRQVMDIAAACNNKAGPKLHGNLGQNSARNGPVVEVSAAEIRPVSVVNIVDGHGPSVAKSRSAGCGYSLDHSAMRESPAADRDMKRLSNGCPSAHPAPVPSLTALPTLASLPPSLLCSNTQNGRPNSLAAVTRGSSGLAPIKGGNNLAPVRGALLLDTWHDFSSPLSRGGPPEPIYNNEPLAAALNQQVQERFRSLGRAGGVKGAGFPKMGQSCLLGTVHAATSGREPPRASTGWRL